MRSPESIAMSNPETETKSITIECIAPDGLGFGEGGISVKEQMRQGILTAEVPLHVNEVLSSDIEAFKSVETDDDGCGDGRPWVKILRRVEVDGNKEIVEYKRSLLRPKVFGGGLVAASSMWRSINGAIDDGDSIESDRAYIADQLSKHGISHGAHTDNQASGDKCGCGAIDNYPLITGNAVKYREQITATLKAVYGEDYEQNQTAIDAAYKVYTDLAENDSYFAGSTGRQAMEHILETDAVVKELFGHHVEETIIINDVAGTTLDQQYFTQTVKDMCQDRPQIIQAFAVDTWRGEQLADTVAKIAVETGTSDDFEGARKIALADFLIRTLAVASTLTAGDLPVYRRRSV